jgi:nucleotide-binding universal stress UspA family protein
MSSNIDWDKIIKKEARGINEAELGEVQHVTDDYVIIQKGLIDKIVYQVPKEKIKNFDGHILQFNLSEDEFTRYKTDSSTPSVREQYLSTTEINRGGGSSGGIHIENKAMESDNTSGTVNNDVKLKEDFTEQITTEDKPIISFSNIPTVSKILVCHDGEKKSDYALNYAIYFSNLTNADIVILKVIDSIESIYGTSIKISNVEETNSNHGSEYKYKVEGDVVNIMEKKIKECKDAGCKSRISYKFRVDKFIEGIERETDENKYDLVILGTSYVNSWLKSAFSDSMKIVRKINIPVLLIHE